MPLMAVKDFERLFRRAAGLDVDKDDLRRLGEFLRDRLYDMLVVAEAHARANGRDVIEPQDLPVTRGLQEALHEFRADPEAERRLEPVLEALAGRPRLDLACSEETERMLPELAGALTIALARLFRVIEPEIRNPQTRHWERAEQAFRLLL